PDRLRVAGAAGRVQEEWLAAGGRPRTQRLQHLPRRSGHGPQRTTHLSTVVSGEDGTPAAQRAARASATGVVPETTSNWRPTVRSSASAAARTAATSARGTSP